MWFSFWRSKNRFSVDELKHLNDQLQKVQIVNDTNKEFVIETLRSIAELVTYGDQHDSSIFEFFMEKQIMSQFLRILKISKARSVAVQLLQTLSIMIQNLQSEHAIYYLFSNEHINGLILYPFDVQNEEILNYYIYFLRAVSGKLDKNTISLLVKTQDDEVISFPLYSEAIKFVHHEENMVRIAVRALTLNIYHVTDEYVHKFITSPPLAGYFLNLVKILQQQCLNLDALVVDASKASDSSQITEKLLVVLAEIGDNLCYCNDVIFAGVACLSRLMTHHLLHSLVLPILLPSLNSSSTTGTRLSVHTSLYLLSFILKEVRFKGLVNSIGAALLYPAVVFSMHFDIECNGHESIEEWSPRTKKLDQATSSRNVDANMQKQDDLHNANESSVTHSPNIAISEECVLDQNLSLRDILLSYFKCEDDKLVLGSLGMLIALVQNRELDDSLLDALGILPQRKQHKQLLLQALMGSKSDEEQLFSPTSSGWNDEAYNDLELCLGNLQGEYQLPISNSHQGIFSQTNRYQVLDSLIMLFTRRKPPAAEVLWHAGYLLRQLLPYEKQKFSNHYLQLLDDAYKKARTDLLRETKDRWCDLVVSVLVDEWKNCKKAIETSELLEGCMLAVPETQSMFPDEDHSSACVGERMRDAVKVFLLHYQLRTSFVRGTVNDGPPLGVSTDIIENARARRAGLDIATPKIGTELNLDDALSCRIAFERGKERPFNFLAVSNGTAGYLLLADEVPLKPSRGFVRIMAPLAGSNPRIDEKHPRWLHLRIRPFNLPSLNSRKVGTSAARSKAKGVVDGRWTVAFSDEQACKSAMSAVLEEMMMQSSAVQKELEPLLNFDATANGEAKFPQEDLS